MNFTPPTNYYLFLTGFEPFTVTPEIELLDNDGAALLDNDGIQLIDNG